MCAFATIICSMIFQKCWDKKSIIYVCFYCVVSFDVSMIYDLYGLHSMHNGVHSSIIPCFNSTPKVAVVDSNPLSPVRQKILHLNPQIFTTFNDFLYLIFSVYFLHLLYFFLNILHVSLILLTTLFMFICLFDLI